MKGLYLVGLIFGGAYIYTEGNLRFKIDWASLIVGSKFTVFAFFYFVFEGNFPSTSSRGAYIWRGDLTEGFCVTGLGGLHLEGLIHGGAYFRNFTVIHNGESKMADSFSFFLVIDDVIVTVLPLLKIIYM